ncbi:MAG: GAF domain-containing protein [bacterium]|nr:GAF domain-containing protein [bacterium]
MLRNARRRWFTLPYSYTNPIERQRASALLYITPIVLLLWAAWVVFTIYTIATADETTPELAPATAVSLGIFPLLLLAIFVLVRRGSLRPASWIFAIFLSIAAVIPVTRGIHTAQIIFPALAIVASGLLLDRPGVWFSLAVTMLGLLVGAGVQTGLTTPPIASPADNISLDLFRGIIVYLMLSFFLLALGGNFQRIIDLILERRDSMGRVARFVTTMSERELSDERTIYQRALVMVRDQLQHTFAQIFLADETGILVQRVRPGLTVLEAELQTNVNVGENSALNDAVRSRQPVQVSTQDSELRRAHLLLTVGYGLEVPIVWGSTLIGVLDVQSGDDPFDNEQIAVLTALAGQIGMLVHNLRTERALRNSLNEQEVILENARDQVRRLRQMQQDTVADTWTEYLTGRGRETLGFDIDGQNGQVSPAQHVPPLLGHALQTGQLEVSQSDGSQVVNVPVTLRGEVLGAMAFTLPPGQVVTERQLEMAQNVADRLALALENKRLFEQTQAQANRERRASEATSLLLTATDVETAIKLAADSFNKALGAVRTRIQLQPEAFNEAPLRSGNNELAASNNGSSGGVEVAPPRRKDEEHLR